jgi:hypothetical protein
MFCIRYVYLLFAIAVLNLFFTKQIHGPEAGILLTAATLTIFRVWRVSCSFKGACLIPDQNIVKETEKMI